MIRNPPRAKAFPDFELWFLLLVGSLVPLCTAFAQSDLEILDVSIPQEEVMWIDFIDRAEESRSYSLLTVAELSASIAAWTLLEDADLSDLEEFYRFTVSLDVEPHRFFRVIAYGDSSDLDGDGLSNEVEAQIGTNAFVADTDGDGFSDGVEFENETDPLDGESTPDLSVLPTVFFSSDEPMQYDESDGSVFIDVTSSDATFSGLVRYELSSLSSLDSADHASLGGALQMENGSGRLEIILTDDQAIESVESVVVDLLASEEGLYRLAYPETTSFVVEDNDSYWIVRLLDEDGDEETLRVRMQPGSSGISGAVIGSQGAAQAEAFSGSLPMGEWPLDIEWTDTQFTAQSGQIPMGSSMLVSADLQRSFSFEAIPPLDEVNPERAYLMERNRIIGEVVETVSSVGGEAAYLDSETRYLFIMIRIGSGIEKGEVPVVEE